MYSTSVSSSGPAGSLDAMAVGDGVDVESGWWILGAWRYVSGKFPFPFRFGEKSSS